MPPVKPRLYDLFPAELFLPDGSAILSGRVLVDGDGRVRVWDVDNNRQIRLRLDSQITLDRYDPNTHPILVGTVPEGRLVVTRVSHCQCGGAYLLRRIEGVDGGQVLPASG